MQSGLGVGRDYTNWIKGRIAKYGFKAGEDYEMFDSPDLANQSGKGGDRRSVGGDTPESVRVAMKPIVEGMGLDWSGQLQRIKRHPVLSRGMVEIPIPSDGGTQMAICLPLNRIAERRALSRSSHSAIVFDAGAKKVPVRISSRHIGARSTRHGKARFGAFFYGRTYGRAQWGAVRLAVCSMRSANPLSPGHQGSSLRSGSLRNGAPQ